MLTIEIKLRVRYAETDRMGYVYYGNYATYFEVARVEAFRKLGFSYKEMEDSGTILPVLDFHIKYIRPALYDDLLTIKVSITQMPTTRLHYEYETFNEKNELLNKATTTLAFVNKETMRPCAAPDYFKKALEKYFADKLD